MSTTTRPVRADELLTLGDKLRCLPEYERGYRDGLAAQPPDTGGAALDVERLRQAIYTISVRHDWEHTTDREDRTEEIAAEYAALRASEVRPAGERPMTRELALQLEYDRSSGLGGVRPDDDEQRRLRSEVRPDTGEEPIATSGGSVPEFGSETA